MKCSGPDQSKRCVSKCDDGFYDYKGTCKRCLSKCGSCHDRPDLCSRCKKPYFLQFTDCVLQCPLGKYGNTKTRKCVACNKRCQSCYDGERNDLCKSCPEGLFLSKFYPTISDKKEKKREANATGIGIRYFFARATHSTNTSRCPSLA